MPLFLLFRFGSFRLFFVGFGSVLALFASVLVARVCFLLVFACFGFVWFVFARFRFVFACFGSWLGFGLVGWLVGWLAGVCWLVGCVVLALVVLLACGLIGCFRHISTMFALRMATVAAESPSCASLLAYFVRCAPVIFVLGCFAGCGLPVLCCAACLTGPHDMSLFALHD